MTKLQERIRDHIQDGLMGPDDLREYELDELIGLYCLSLKPSEQSEHVTESTYYNEWLANLFTEFRDAGLRMESVDSKHVGDTLIPMVRNYSIESIRQEFEKEIENTKEPVIDFDDGMDNDRRTEAQAINADMRAGGY